MDDYGVACGAKAGRMALKVAPGIPARYDRISLMPHLLIVAGVLPGSGLVAEQDVA